MRFYFAAAYKRRKEIKKCIEKFNTLSSHQAVGKWASNHYGEDDVTEDVRVRDAMTCLHEIATCDAIVEFNGATGQGGRHVEFGYALAMGKRIISIGEREHIFDYLPYVERYESFDAFLTAVTLGNVTNKQPETHRPAEG